ncbi:MAG: hypothetical protein ABI591_03325 [Kofleriaceae bacterium]
MTTAGLGLVIGFALVVAATLWFATRAVGAASPRAKLPFLLGALAWLAILGVLADRGFFLETTASPPHLIVAVGPPLLAILVMFVAGRRFVERLPLQTLTYLHLVRAGVGFVLFGLAMSKLVPIDMTFAGHNFDIAIGFTAPVLGNLAFLEPTPARKPLLVWNVIALGFLVYVVVVAVLSAPLPFQQFNFDRPNIAILQFPFVWLPGFVVPIVLASHLVAFRRLLPRS